jgi:hypothetical protein
VFRRASSDHTARKRDNEDFRTGKRGVETDIPGHGWSSPIVWNDHVLLTAAISSGAEPTPVPGFVDPADDSPMRLSTPAMPRVVASYATTSPALDVAVANSLVLVALAKGDVIILRTEN